MMQLPPQVPGVQSFGQVPASGAEGPARPQLTAPPPATDAMIQQLRAPSMPGPGTMPRPMPMPQPMPAAPSAPMAPNPAPGFPGAPGRQPKMFGLRLGGRGKSGPAPGNYRRF